LNDGPLIVIPANAKGIFPLPSVGEGRVRGEPLIRLDADTHLATFSLEGRRKTFS